MSSRQITTPWFASGLPGLLLAVLALVSQLALGAAVLPDEALAREQSAVALDALTVLCDSGTPARPKPVHHRHAADCALCPLSVALALPAVVPATGPDVPVPQNRVTGRIAVPPAARAPPGQPRHTTLPRGPPVLT